MKFISGTTGYTIFLYKIKAENHTQSRADSQTVCTRYCCLCVMFYLVSLKPVGFFRTLYQSAQFSKQLLTPSSTSHINQLFFVNRKFKFIKYPRIVVHGYIIYLISLQGILWPRDYLRHPDPINSIS